MKTRQKTRTPTMEMDLEFEERACARVAKMMIINSSPYIRFRPTMSASQPKPTWPRTVPPDVATLMAVSELLGIFPLLDWKKTTPSMELTRLMAKRSYASVKKPTPATTIARTWYHPKGALSISAKARRRRSLGSATWANWLW